MTIPRPGNSSTESRPRYTAPRITSYDEAQVAEQLGPVMLSGTGTQLQELQGNTSSTPMTHVPPRR
jgi:hypothetical protein